MFVQTSINVHQLMVKGLQDYPWLAGAARGLEMSYSVPENYANRLREEIDTLAISSVTPGDSYDFGDGLKSSAYDVLGGYVSVSGIVHPAGLLVPIPLSQQNSVRRLVSIIVSLDERWMIVPLADCERFMRLVPLKGPIVMRLLEHLEEVIT